MFSEYWLLGIFSSNSYISGFCWREASWSKNCSPFIDILSPRRRMFWFSRDKWGREDNNTVNAIWYHLLITIRKYVWKILVQNILLLLNRNSLFFQQRSLSHELVILFVIEVLCIYSMVFLLPPHFNFEWIYYVNMSMRLAPLFSFSQLLTY